MRLLNPRLNSPTPIASNIIIATTVNGMAEPCLFDLSSFVIWISPLALKDNLSVESPTESARIARKSTLKYGFAMLLSNTQFVTGHPSSIVTINCLCHQTEMSREARLFPPNLKYSTKMGKSKNKQA